MAPYLATGTVGLFDVDDRDDDRDSTGATIPIFTAIDSAGSPQRKADVTDTADRVPEMVNFLGDRFGPYPFETVGIVADWVPDVGYTLENQTKPHFAGNKGGPAGRQLDARPRARPPVDGDSVTPANWSVIWFNEGWATFSEVLFDSKVDGRRHEPQGVLRRGLRLEAEELEAGACRCWTTIPPTCSTAWPSTTGRERCFRVCE